MARYRHVAFVCTNERDPSDPRGSCKGRGSAALLDRLKELTHERGLKREVRVVGSGCLDYCARGCAVAVFSAEGPTPQTWYTRVTPGDADELFDHHLSRGEQVVRLAEPDKK
ncbi:MAG: (2Fe-2S) ferredoxin domain-containing protein [Myxococcota bacterium]